MEWIFHGNKLDKVTVITGVFCWPQICQKCVGRRGFAPDPAGGAHDAPSRLGMGSLSIPHPLGAFGASILAPSALSYYPAQCKISWLRPCLIRILVK